MRPISRAVDGLLSRGAGLDDKGDPFGPPLGDDEARTLKAAARAARYEDDAPPFAAPLALPQTGARVGVWQSRACGDDWAIVAPPYGGFARAGIPGLYLLHARLLHRQGFSVAMPELPYHGARVPDGHPSGWGFVRADLGHTSRSVIAAAAETVALARWLRERQGARRVVGWGLSLGGAALGLGAALGAPIDRLAFVAGVDSPASFYATGQNREARRRTLRANGYDQARIVEAFRSVAPSTHAAPDAPAAWAIPLEDQVVPAWTQQAWRAAWDGTEMPLRWEGHGIALASPLVAARMARWLAMR